MFAFIHIYLPPYSIFNLSQNAILFERWVMVLDLYSLIVRYILIEIILIAKIGGLLGKASLKGNPFTALYIFRRFVPSSGVIFNSLYAEIYIFTSIFFHRCRGSSSRNVGWNMWQFHSKIVLLLGRFRPLGQLQELTTWEGGIHPGLWHIMGKCNK